MRRLAFTLAVLLVLGGGGAAAFARWGDGAEASTEDDPVDTEVVEVERRTLVDAERVAGELGYDEAQQVSADQADGVLTWLPAEGSVLQAGDVAYRVDEEPVVLLTGRLPLYRDLSYGVDAGADVRQLERNLKRLGYDPGTVNREFTEYSAGSRRGAPGGPRPGGDRRRQRGAVPRAARSRSGWVPPRPLSARQLMPGTPTALYDATSTRRVVTVDIDPSDENLVEVGVSATVTLPDGSTLEAEVSEVGTVATASDSETEEAEEASADATLPVTLTFADAAGAKGLSAAPVTVDVTRDRRRKGARRPDHRAGGAGRGWFRRTT